MAKEVELDKLFAQEVRTRQEHIRSQAIQAVLAKRQFRDDITVHEFLGSLRSSKDLWDGVANMGIVTFANCISNTTHLEDEVRRLRSELAALRQKGVHHPSKPTRRTRLSNAQKGGLKRAVIDVLRNRTEGLPRIDVAAQIPDGRLQELGLPRSGLASKLRIPIAELLREGMMTTRGEKRFMRYLLRAQAS